MTVTVYADILVIVNLYIDFFLLWCVKKILHLRARGRRLVLGAAVGAVLSLTSLLPELPPWDALLFSAATAVAVTAAAFAPFSVKMLVKSSVCFFAASFLLAGFFIFLLRFFAPKNVVVLGSVIYFDLSPLLLFVFTCAAYLVFSVGQKLLPKGSPSERFFTLLIENRGKQVSVLAKADTGSSLREPFSGLPVIVCQADSIKDILPLGIAEVMKTESEAALPKMTCVRAVPFESLGGRGILPAFKPERVSIAKSGRALECYVAVCERRLSAGQFAAIFNPDLIDGETEGGTL